jgi:hypothetical protein
MKKEHGIRSREKCDLSLKSFKRHVILLDNKNTTFSGGCRRCTLSEWRYYSMLHVLAVPSDAVSVVGLSAVWA